jgi:hypothetical protein
MDEQDGQDENSPSEPSATRRIGSILFILFIHVKKVLAVLVAALSRCSFTSSRLVHAIDPNPIDPKGHAILRIDTKYGDIV